MRVGEQIRQCLSEVLLEGGLKDPRLSQDTMITVTEVRMAPDLRSGRVLVSVFPEDSALEETVFSGLESAKAHLKAEIATRLRLRFTPELRFDVDHGLREGAKISRLLEDIAKEDEAR